MNTAATVWNNPAAPNAQAMSARPTVASSGASSQSDPSTITANDFLTLLVTEMKNQDPTSAGDPNQYINQLVSVNSLEQLIQINQTLLLGLTASTSTPAGQAIAPASRTRADSSRSETSSPAAQLTATVAPGNLSVPGTNPAAQQVAKALSGAAHF